MFRAVDHASRGRIAAPRRPHVPASRVAAERLGHRMGVREDDGGRDDFRRDSEFYQRHADVVHENEV